MEKFYILKRSGYEAFRVTYRGLNPKQVSENQKKYGKNILEEKAPPSKARFFWNSSKIYYDYFNYCCIDFAFYRRT